ncbi:MAG: htpX 1 [Pedosphaera sp.]|nr:htpX 1 [Pedosphaera sp.]
MTHAEFDKLVQGVEAGVGRDARALYRRVLGLAAVGYASLMLPLACVVLVGAAFIVPGILWPRDAIISIGFGALVLALGGWAAGKMLWVKLPPPKGREVFRHEAPVLFATLDDLRHKLRSTPFDRVIILPDCNAFVAPRPRLGAFGWNQNNLLLGLPLMEGLSKGELTAVLAHECAHLSKQHHRSGQWVYRLRRSWQQVFESMARRRVHGEISFRPLIQKFIGWFWPRFNAHAFVLSRVHEYQADAVAAKLAGAPNIATALIRIGWYSRVLEEKFWPDIWQQTRSEALPPENVFLRLGQLLGGINPSSESKWLEKAFRAVTTNADTHPCLSERLRAIGWTPNDDGGKLRVELGPARPNAAEVFFGHALATIRADVEQNWRKECETEWRKQYSKANVLADRINQLDQGPASKKEDVDVLWDKARMLMDLQHKEPVLPLLRQILDLDPQHVAANFNMGSYMLQSDDAGGEAFLERAIAGNEELLPQAANSLHGHYQRTGQSERIRELYARLDLHEKSIAASRLERASVTASDNILAHDLSEAEVEALRQILVAQTDLAGAHLGKKELKYFAQQRLYLLCIRIRPPWHRFPNDNRERFAVNQLIKATRLPGRVLIFTARGSFRGVARKLVRVPGTKILPRD